MRHDDIHSRQLLFNEVKIANFKDFQIAIPSRSQTVLRKLFSTWVPLPKRIYHTRGGIIWNRQLKYSLSELRIRNLFQKASVFPELRRLATGIPVSFEIKSVEPLPAKIVQQAILTCRMTEKESIYCSVFRDLIPKNVKIFSCQGIMHLTDQIDFISMLSNK